MSRGRVCPDVQGGGTLLCNLSDDACNVTYTPCAQND